MANVFSKEQRIRFEHCDPAGIVFYPRYFEMLNGLMEDFFREVLAYPFEQMHEDSGVPTVAIQAEFKAPAKLGDVLTKRLWIKKLGGSSCTYGYNFTHADTLILEGEGTIVYASLQEDGITPKKWGALRELLLPYVAE